MAQKINDSTFNKLANTNALFANVNDTVNYVVYAPCLTEHGLELFYSRLLHSGTQTEVMVASRNNTTCAFGSPSVLVGSPYITPEAPTLTSDKSKMYYHRKAGSIYKIFVRYRNLSTGLNEAEPELISCFPNPVNAKIEFSKELNLVVYDSEGKKKFEGKAKEINTCDWQNGIYFVRSGNNTFKFLVSH